MANSSTATSAEEELKRIMHLHSKATTDPFVILGLDIETCEFSDVAKKYRKIVVHIHPDKCKLPHAAEAFKIVEKAYSMVKDEGILQRLKIAHQRKKEREEKLKATAAEKTAHHASDSATSSSHSHLSKEQRIEKMREATRAEEYMEAARKAQEAVQKKARHEKKQSDDAAISAALEKQIKEEKDLHLF